MFAVFHVMQSFIVTCLFLNSFVVFNNYLIIYLSKKIIKGLLNVNN